MYFYVIKSIFCYFLIFINKLPVKMFILLFLSLQDFIAKKTCVRARRLSELPSNSSSRCVFFFRFPLLQAMSSTERSDLFSFQSRNLGGRV